MNPIFKPCAAVVFAVGALAVYGTMAQPAANTPAKDTAPCAAAEYRDFDFWIGDWDVFDVSDPKNPKRLSTIPGFVRQVAVRGNVAYLADLYKGFRLFNVSDREHAVRRRGARARRAAATRDA